MILEKADTNKTTAMSKEAISITIDKDVLKEADKFIQKDNRGSRSNYIETAVKNENERRKNANKRRK